MMTIEQKQRIKALVLENVTIMGGQRQVATKAKVSPATISQIINDNWELISEDMWRKIAAALGYRDDNWKVVDNIFNMRVIETTFNDAKKHSMMMAVSHKAGSGKTEGCKVYLDKNKGKQVYYIHCREWTIKQFLHQLCRTLGIEKPRGIVTSDELLELIIDFFMIRADKRPLLVVDEADKLKGAAIRVFIPLFNATEDRLGIVILGTEHLAEEIKRGVRYNKKGYDEIDSRLGRQYVKLYGANKQDVQRICSANGITNKRKQEYIWKECQPKEVSVGGQFLRMVDDLRRLKRVIQREVIVKGELN